MGFWSICTSDSNICNGVKINQLTTGEATYCMLSMINCEFIQQKGSDIVQICPEIQIKSH